MPVIVWNICSSASAHTVHGVPKRSDFLRCAQELPLLGVAYLGSTPPRRERSGQQPACPPSWRASRPSSIPAKNEWVGVLPILFSSFPPPLWGGESASPGVLGGEGRGYGQAASLQQRVPPILNSREKGTGVKNTHPFLWLSLPAPPRAARRPCGPTRNMRMSPENGRLGKTPNLPFSESSPLPRTRGRGSAAWRLPAAHASPGDTSRREG